MIIVKKNFLDIYRLDLAVIIFKIHENLINLLVPSNLIVLANSIDHSIDFQDRDFNNFDCEKSTNANLDN